MIQAIVTVAMETILQDNAYIPRQLFETAVVFHGKSIFDGIISVYLYEVCNIYTLVSQIKIQ